MNPKSTSKPNSLKSTFSTKASINGMGLSREILSSKDAKVIWLREIPMMCCLSKNTKYPVFMPIVFYIWKAIKRSFFHRLTLAEIFDRNRKKSYL